VIVIVLGVYPKVLLDLQSPGLVKLADQVRAAAPSDATRVAVAPGGVER